MIHLSCIRVRVAVWILLLRKITLSITRYRAWLYRITVTIRTKDETATAGRHRAYAWQPHNCILCKIHIYRYYGRAYINRHAYISVRSARDSKYVVTIGSLVCQIFRSLCCSASHPTIPYSICRAYLDL